MTNLHPLKGIPIEPWMLKNIREQSQLLMQLAMSNTDKQAPAKGDERKVS